MTDEVANDGNTVDETAMGQAFVAANGTQVSYGDAKRRFLESVETEINPARRTTIESYFELSIEPFFLGNRVSQDPQEWPQFFDLFRNWLRKCRKRNNRKGTIKARTANLHIAALNKFLRFCREVYGLQISANCKRFSKRIVDQELRARDGRDLQNGDSVWNEDEFAQFSKLAHDRDPYVAPIFDVAFGLGLRRGEAIALRTDRVHLTDTRMGPWGYVDIVEQYAWDPALRQPVLKLPKSGKPRSVPIPCSWLRDSLQERISGRGAVRPRDNSEGLRYVAGRYTNLLIAEVIGVTEAAVRKWLKRHGLKGRRPVGRCQRSADVERDIRGRLLFGQMKRKPKDYLFTDGQGRLPSPDHVEKVFQRLVKQCGLKRIRLHDLRHSFGSIWAERVPPTVLKEMMGHSSITTTERYIHTTDEIYRRTMEAAQRK